MCVDPRPGGLKNRLVEPHKGCVNWTGYHLFKGVLRMVKNKDQSQSQPQIVELRKAPQAEVAAELPVWNGRDEGAGRGV